MKKSSTVSKIWGFIGKIAQIYSFMFAEWINAGEIQYEVGYNMWQKRVPLKPYVKSEQEWMVCWAYQEGCHGQYGTQAEPSTWGGMKRGKYLGVLQSVGIPSVCQV